MLVPEVMQMGNHELEIDIGSTGSKFKDVEKGEILSFAQLNKLMSLYVAGI